jgi:hypothetical protein
VLACQLDFEFVTVHPRPIQCMSVPAVLAIGHPAFASYTTAMFIELTDALRCTADHPESYLVLLPGKLEGRQVISGELGCPVCGRVVQIVDGVVDFGGGMPSDGQTALSAEAVAAFLGISGPGGYVALVGGVTSLAEELAQLLPNVGLALINPPDGLSASYAAGVLRAGRLPLKSGSMRGVVVGADLSGNGEWVPDAVRAVLSGLRIVAEGAEPPADLVEVLAASPECWVGRIAPAA